MTSEPVYLRSLYILDNFVDRDLTIDLTPTEGRGFMHLILTGRNGCGKTTTLRLLGDELERGEARRAVGWVGATRPAIVWAGGPGVVPELTRDQGRGLNAARAIRLVARRNISIQRVGGPTGDLTLTVPDRFEQHLVNLDTRAAYAARAGDDAKVEEIQDRLDRYRDALRLLFGEPHLALAFDADDMRYRLSFGDRRVDLQWLPDGYVNALQIWLEILAMTQRSGEDWGIVLIDELEAHLHLSLQASILPFLTKSFPNVQFVIATHSPVVISSVEGAVVYDLSSHTRVLSDELRGKEFGSLMTGHFGMADDVDLATVQELRELRALYRLPSRTADQESRLRELAGRLSRRSHTIALKIWSELEPEVA